MYVVACQWHTDENGIKREFHGRNKAQDQLKHDTHHRDLEVQIYCCMLFSSRQT